MEVTLYAQVATSDDDSKQRAGLLFHNVSKAELKPGDHIYAYRAKGLYAHHGIYIGEQGMEVINFSGNKIAGNASMKVQSCTLEEFQGSASCVRLVAYNVSSFASFVKRSLTTHQYKSRPANAVVEEAKYFLRNPDRYGRYNLLFNNCESFAIYCKTRRTLLSSQIMPFQSMMEQFITGGDDDDDKEECLLVRFSYPEVTTCVRQPRPGPVGQRGLSRTLTLHAISNSTTSRMILLLTQVS